MDRRTDGRLDKAGCRVACTRLKIQQNLESRVLIHFRKLLSSIFMLLPFSPSRLFHHQDQSKTKVKGRAYVVELERTRKETCGGELRKTIDGQTIVRRLNKRPTKFPLKFGVNATNVIKLILDRDFHCFYATW